LIGLCRVLYRHFFFATYVSLTQSREGCAESAKNNHFLASLAKNFATLAVPYLPSSVFGLRSSVIILILQLLICLIWLKTKTMQLEFFSENKMLSKSKNQLIL